MADVNINKFRASVVRDGSKPASPGFIVSEGQDPVDPAGNGQNHLPVTIATAATGLSITDSQVLGGAGTVGQYIRGDGSLADFPATTGGGSSVSYYLNGSVSQGTIGGVAYKELNRTPIFGAGTDITINADGYIASFITDALDPNKLLIPAGNWNFETYFSASSSGGTPSFYVELYKYNGTTFTLIATSSAAPELIAFGTSLNPYFSTLAVPETVLALTDRLALRYYVSHSGRTITLHTENGHLCEVITTFTTGLTALNGLTNQVQFFAVGTSGTDFAISSATDTHTFNLPTASATNRGALSSADWTTFNNKTSNLGTVTSVGLSSATSGVTIGSTPVTSSGTITIAIATATSTQNGLLSSTDWSTFNNKQNALTNPVTGTGTTNYLPKFTGSTTIGNSILQDSGTRLTQNTGDGFVISTSSSDTVGGGSFLALANSTQTRWILQQINASFGLDWWSFNGTGWSTRMQLTAGGNLLVGTTTDAGFKLDVNGTGRFSSTGNALRIASTSTANNVQLYITNNNNGDVYTGVAASDGSSVFTGTTAYSGYIGTNLNVPFYIATNGTARVTIASTGAATFSSSVTATNGNFSGLTRITGVTGVPSTGQGLELYYNSSTGLASVGSYDRGAGVQKLLELQALTISLKAGGSERVLITSSGNVLIGTTTDNGVGRLQVSGGSITVAGGVRFSASGADANRWSVYWNGGTGDLIVVNNISDIRAKKDFDYDIKGLETINKLKPLKFTWKDGTSHSTSVSGRLRQYGFIAQETMEADDYLAWYNKSQDTWGIEQYESFSAVIVKAIQEQQEIINDLKQKIG